MEKEKLQQLLNSLTWTEKVGQLVQLSGEFFQHSELSTGPRQKLGITDEIMKNLGSVLNVTGAKDTKEVQDDYLINSRHKIPLIFMADIIYGYRTVFPIPLGLGATWDTSLIHKVYQVIGKESHAGGADVTYAPMVDLVRDARWGRTLESTGEDSLLNADFARAMVTGLQKNLVNQTGIASCVKHFAAYGAVEAGRDYNTVDMSERRLRQDYLPSYYAAVDAGVKMVMTSFNTYDGVPATGNKHLLKEILREEWGFDGVIISDYAAVRELIDHGIARDNKEATKLAMQATNDIDMKSPSYANELEDLVRNGEIDDHLVDQAVWRVLKLKNDLGLFEDPYRGTNEQIEQNELLKPENRELACQAAEESIVLLKNEENILPLKPNQEKILLVGPYGDSQELIGLWAVHGKKEDTTSIKDGISEYLDNEHFTFEQGCDLLKDYTILGEFGASEEDMKKASFTDEEKQQHLEQAVELGKQADVIIYALGEHTMQSGEAGSRSDITLPKTQQDFVDEMLKLDKKNILITISGRPLVLTKEQQQFDAILQAWFPGTEGGRVLANTIFGEKNPSERLSMSFPYTVGQMPMYYNNFRTGRPLDSSTHSGRFISKYQDAPNDPLYPFGYGLNYSDVHYENLRLSSNKLKLTNQLKIVITAINNSAKTCTETVQLYVCDQVGSVVRPMKELKKYQKVEIPAHEKVDVEFVLTEKDLRFYRKDMSYGSEKGDFTVFVGPNSRDVLTENFYLE